VRLLRFRLQIGTLRATDLSFGAPHARSLMGSLALLLPGYEPGGYAERRERETVCGARGSPM
jgi:hypothetical protein